MHIYTRQELKHKVYYEYPRKTIGTGQRAMPCPMHATMRAHVISAVIMLYFFLM